MMTKLSVSKLFNPKSEDSSKGTKNDDAMALGGESTFGAVIAEVENAKLYQIDPSTFVVGVASGVSGEKQNQKQPEKAPASSPVSSTPSSPFAAGKLALREPVQGATTEEGVDVTLVGECDGIICYMIKEDVVVKISEKMYLLMLPPWDCILLDLTDCGKSGDVSGVLMLAEHFLQERTSYMDQSNENYDTVKSNRDVSCSDSDKKTDDNRPNDPVSKAIFRASAVISRLIIQASNESAQRIEKYGEKKRDSIPDANAKNVKIGETPIRIAEGARSASKTMYSYTSKLSERISDAIGSKLGKSLAIKEDDTPSKKKTRQLILASTLAFAEIADSVSEGYEVISSSAKRSATGVVEKKYGEEAAVLTKHAVGTGVNVGRTVLTARRVVDGKKIAKGVVKSAGKNMVKETLKGR